MAIASTLLALQGQIIHNPWQSLGITVFLAPILYVILNEFIRASVRVKGMKGPRGLPLIGNLAQIRVNAAEQYRVWSKKFGAVYQIQLGNVPVVVVNSAASAKVIFGQNAQALSSRPEFYTFHKVSNEYYPHTSSLHALTTEGTLLCRLFQTLRVRPSELRLTVTL
jgi:3-hydroxyphenylacetate 6-hydroxylase